MSYAERRERGPWAVWDGPLEHIYLDADVYTTLGAAMHQARLWAEDTHDEWDRPRVSAWGARKFWAYMHEKCDDGYCGGEVKGCLQTAHVWFIPFNPPARTVTTNAVSGKHTDRT